MYELTKKMYLTKQIPKHFEVINISNEPIVGLKVDKLLFNLSISSSLRMAIYQRKN